MNNYMFRKGGISIGLLWGAIATLVGSVFTISLGNIKETDAEQNARLTKVEDTLVIIKETNARIDERLMHIENAVGVKRQSFATSSKIAL